MTDFGSIQNDLTTLLATTLTAEGVELVGENAQHDGSARAPSSEWAEFRVLDAPRPWIGEIGGRTTPHTGSLMVELYTPLGEGSARARAIADALASAFQGVRVGSVACYDVDFRPGGRDPGSAFWHSGCSRAVFTT